MALHLVQMGADVRARIADEWSENPIDYARGARHDWLAQWLEEHGTATAVGCGATDSAAASGVPTHGSFSAGAVRGTSGRRVTAAAQFAHRGKAGSALSDGDGESMAWLAEAVAALDATGHGSSLVPAEVRGAVARVAPNV